MSYLRVTVPPMARPELSRVDLWTWAVSYGDRPPFAYLREKLPDYDGEKRFSVYTGHENIPDSFRRHDQGDESCRG